MLWAMQEQAKRPRHGGMLNMGMKIGASSDSYDISFPNQAGTVLLAAPQGAHTYTSANLGLSNS